MAFVSSSNCLILFAVASSKPWYVSIGNFVVEEEILLVEENSEFSSKKFCALFHDLVRNSRLDRSNDLDDEDDSWTD
jgi:hypothetical protein